MLQQGHRRRAVLISLLLGIAILLLVAAASLALPGRSARRESRAGRPVITTILPAEPAVVRPQQGSGPAPDTNLTPNTPATQELDPFAWRSGSTDRIAFASNGTDADGDRRIDPVPPLNAKFNLWIMRPDGSEQIQMSDIPGDSREPAIDASRNLFAFANNQTGTWQIYTIDLATKVVRQITTGAGNKRHPTWSPDQNWIVFQSDAAGNWDIWKIRSDGAGAPVQLTTTPEDETDPCWHPRGNTIVFTGEVGAVTRIFTMDDSGGNVTPLSNGGGDPQVSDKQATWQEDGSTLVFASNRDSTGRHFNIWRMAASGEIVGPVPTRAAEGTPDDTFDNTNPCLTTPMNRQELRTVYESTKTPPSGNVDLYSHFLEDVLPPRLLRIPTVDNRLPAPGGDVTVSVPVFDAGSGVRDVIAFFKDPDRKLYSVSDPASFDAGFEDGVRYLEVDCRTVGSVELTDPDGDGVFTGTFTTALAPHDYIIDIQATDNVGNSLRYDDIYGFSTETFTPTGKILFVDDYCEGQEFISQLGDNNDFPVAFPVESYYRNNPGFAPGALGTIDYDSIAGQFGLSYDTWRVICRGRVPSTIYQIYKPTIEYQLDPATAAADPVGAQPTRVVRVSERMIVWAAPHTGNVWVPVDSGSVVDPSVQADLTNYLNTGGKLFIAGEDIGWALTLNGTTSNAFFTGTLHAGFVTDIAAGYGFTATGQAADPVTGAIWGWALDGEEAPVNLVTPRVTNDGTDRKLDAADWSYRPDAINVLAPAVKIYGLAGAGNANFDGPAGGLRYQDPVTGAQLVFLSFGFEQVHRGYHSTNNIDHCMNHRSNLITNAYIWMTTGTIQGRVLRIDGSPITNPNPIVRINGAGGEFAVRCQDDGTYVINGLPPGAYNMEAFRPGYDIDKSEGNWTHAALDPPPTQDFALSPVAPGAISGTVRSAATGLPLANVTVNVYLAESGTTPPAPPGNWQKGTLVGTTVTAADGTYSVGGLDPVKYIVEADGSAIGYSTEEAVADVTSGNNTTVDFLLDSAPGTLTVTVLKPDATPLVNATVQVLKGAVLVQSGATDSNGQAQFDLAADSYNVIASAAGYGASAPTPVTIESGQPEDLVITLSPEPPGALSGRVVSATGGQPIGGIIVHLQVNGVDVAPTVTTLDRFITPPVGQPYNYRFDNAPTGQVDVVPEAPGFTVQPPSRSVTVVTGQETQNVNFQLSSLHAFPAGLSLMSTPYDYEFKNVGGVDVNDPARLFGLVGETLLMATYLPNANRYAMYPNAPADHFRLGRGYWLKPPTAVDLTRQGVPASDPHPIRIKPGFNLIGDPFTRPIDFTTVQVEDATGARMSLQQAATANPPKLQAVLFAYVLGGYRTVSVLSPWVGYWVRAGEPLTLWVSEAVGGLSAEAADSAEKGWGLPVPAGGWLLPLTVSAGRCADESTFLGVSPQGAGSFDARVDLVKPPAADFEPFVYAALVKDGAPGPLAADLRGAGDGRIWTLSVKTNQIGSRVTVRWPDLSLLPADARPVLEDLATGRRVYMRTTSAYQFVAQVPERLFTITVTQGAAPAAVVSALSASAAGGGASVVYTLSAEAAVTVDIRNISGVLIRRLSEGAPQAAGVQTLLWNGKNQRGSPAPAGQYLVQVRAVTAEGRVNQAVTNLWLTR